MKKSSKLSNSSSSRSPRTNMCWKHWAYWRFNTTNYHIGSCSGGAHGNALLCTWLCTCLGLESSVARNKTAHRRLKSHLFVEKKCLQMRNLHFVETKMINRKYFARNEWKKPRITAECALGECNGGIHVGWFLGSGTYLVMQIVILES